MKRRRPALILGLLIALGIATLFWIDHRDSALALRQADLPGPSSGTPLAVLAASAALPDCGSAQSSSCKPKQGDVATAVPPVVAIGQGPRPQHPPQLPPAPGLLAAPMPAPEPGYVPVRVLDCVGMFPAEAGRAQQCRLGEKQRLTADCAKARQREAAATSDGERKTQAILIRSICREAERYMPVP